MVPDQFSIGLLAAPNYRSRAIVQMLQYAGIKIGEVVILPGDEPVWCGQTKFDIPLYCNKIKIFPFRPGQSLRETLATMNVPYVLAPTQDINTIEFIKFIQERPQSIYLYSGVAGCILRTALLRDSGKRFIHAHGGDAPRYSGSTAFYYSILERGDIGATVFWMDEGLDTGAVIGRIVTQPYHGVEIDRIQDPIIRAEAIVLALDQIGHDRVEEQDHSDRVTYHVIHPVLKHYALVKTGLGIRS